MKNNLEEFFQVKNLSLNSQKCYRNDLEKFSRAFGLKVNLNQLKPREVLEKFSDLSERSRQRLCVNLRIYLLWLRDSKELKIDSAWNQSWKFNDYKKIQPRQKIIEIPTEKEIDLILSFKTQITLVKRVLIALIIHTGASLEELANLRWSDLSWQSGYLVLGAAEKKRAVPLEKKCLEILFEYQKDYPESKQVDYLFHSPKKQTRTPAIYFSIWVLAISRKFLDKDYSVRNYQAYAREKLLKEKGLKLSQKYLAKQTKNALIQSEKSESISSEELKELKELHLKAFS